MRITILKTAIFSAFLVLSACSTTKIQMNVSSLNSGRQLPGKKMLIFINNSQDSDLQKQEYKNYAENVAKQAGFEPVNDIKSAELFVSIVYGMANSQQIGSRPVMNYVAPKTYNFNSASTTSQFGSLNSWSTNTSGTISESGIGHFEQVGTETFSYTVYHRGITITAYDAEQVRAVLGKNSTQSKSLKLDPIWETQILSSGSSNDMRQIFPAMLAGAYDYIGANTKGKIAVEIAIDDPKIKLVTDGPVINSANERVPASKK